MCANEVEQFTAAQVDDELRAALGRLFQADAELLDYDVNERSVSRQLAEYLQEGFGRCWNVDCEYNRKGHNDTKKLRLPVETTQTDNTEARTVFPDIIVHRRGSPENLLSLR